jgi:endonuclease I
MSKHALRLAGALVVLCTGGPISAQADVLISELCDPRLNYTTDRFIEIFNPNDEAVDLTGWRLVAVANGADAFTWQLSGLIDAHQALVAGDATTVAVFPVAFPEEGWSGANGSWNGKVGDGAKLLDPIGTVTDYVVALGTAFENADYVRTGVVTAPNPVYTPAEWATTQVDLATDASPGIHDTSPPFMGPRIASIHTDPASPGVGDSVGVFADVADSSASITMVVLTWGTTPTSLPNEIGMSPVSGDTYRTIASIPPQPGGTTVYYRIGAANDLPATTISSLQSFRLGYPATLHEIQGESSASPFDGMIVTTHGVVTARYGTTFVLQDGIGPWNGLWVRGTTAPALRDSVTVTGRVTESDGPGNLGNTVLVEAQVESTTPGAVLPDVYPIDTAGVEAESVEGVLVRVVNAECTDPDIGAGEWQVDDGSGASLVGVLGYRAAVTLGSTYQVSGPVAYGLGRFKIEPRDSADVLWMADHAAPVVLLVVALNDTALRVSFSEAVEPVSAGDAEHYAVAGLVVSGVTRESTHPNQVLLAVSSMAPGDYTLTVAGVFDLYGNASAGATASFTYYGHDIPPGYYDAVAGLTGETLQAALHDIIKNHTAHSYDYAWTAYYTTDVRPGDGKVWDIYSDIPGGTPPYLYTFGVNQGGVGGHEGTGYTREHTWCKNWFGGEVSPMYTDLFTLYPCDTHVNGTRGVNPYGETAVPQWTSLNGSKVGPSSIPGYSGTVFEPIDDFKGDLARAYFYFSTRYYSEDAAWPGGPATEGATLRSWALDLFLRWSDEDPVSQKEINRNSAIYAIQGNRNPFVDRPEFVDLVYGSRTPVLFGIDEARADDEGVHLAWQGDGRSVALAMVERRRHDEDWHTAGHPEPVGDSRLEFLDRQVERGARYGYRLVVHDRAGGVSAYGETWVDVPALTLALRGPVTNPSLGPLSVRFMLPDAEPATLEVFSVAGKRVGRREVGSLGAGVHTVDLVQERLPSGMYWIRLKHGPDTLTARAVILRSTP